MMIIVRPKSRFVTARLLQLHSYGLTDTEVRFGKMSTAEGKGFVEWAERSCLSEQLITILQDEGFGSDKKLSQLTHTYVEEHIKGRISEGEYKKLQMLVRRRFRRSVQQLSSDTNKSTAASSGQEKHAPQPASPLKPPKPLPMPKPTLPVPRTGKEIETEVTEIQTSESTHLEGHIGDELHDTEYSHSFQYHRLEMLPSDTIMSSLGFSQQEMAMSKRATFPQLHQPPDTRKVMPVSPTINALSRTAAIEAKDKDSETMATTSQRISDVALSTTVIKTEDDSAHTNANDASSSPVTDGGMKTDQCRDLQNAPEKAVNMDRSSGELFRFLLLGRSGSGKSATGNTILGERRFQCGASLNSMTHECEAHGVRLKSGKENVRVEVMDCPGLYDTQKSHEEIATMIVQAVAFMHPGPHAILFIVSAVTRYTDEEHSVYERIKAIFDGNVTKHMIVVFTHGDDLEREKLSFHDLLTCVPPRLARVIAESKCRPLLFNNFAKNKKPQVNELLKEARKLVQDNGGPYECPKYKIIGERLEREVQRRVKEMKERDLENKRKIKEMEKKLTEAQTQLARMTNEFKRKEEERKQLLELFNEVRQQKDVPEREQLMCKKEEQEEERERQRQELQALENEVKRCRTLAKEREEEEERKYQEDLETMRYSVARKEPSSADFLRKRTQQLRSLFGKSD